jgi:membrane dipeptidase
MIRALAKKGGVIQININCGFVSQKTADAPKSVPAPRATLADVVAHIDHVKQIAGIDTIGIGTDFDGISCTPEGLDDVSKFPNLTRALLERGYTPNEIKKIYGGNTLRLMRQVEKVAADMQRASR